MVEFPVATPPNQPSEVFLVCDVIEFLNKIILVGAKAVPDGVGCLGVSLASTY